MKPNPYPIEPKQKMNLRTNITGWLISLLLVCFSCNSLSQPYTVSEKLAGFDEYVNKVLAEWNIAGAGVGIVYKNEPVYAKGYGYRDYENKLPVTPNTLFQIASNTKLFTAVSVGMLVNKANFSSILSYKVLAKQLMPSGSPRACIS